MKWLDTLVKWLDLRSREERKQYIHELFGPTTRENFIWLISLGGALLGVSFLTIFIIDMTKIWLGSQSVNWAREWILPVLGFSFLGIYLHSIRKGKK